MSKQLSCLEHWNQGELITGLKALREKTRGRQQVRVAVLDGEIDNTHPVLAHQSLATAQAASDHGTHIASVIAGRSDDYCGIAPDITLLSVPVYPTGSDGKPGVCTQQTLADAIHQACDQQALLINISGGEVSHRTPLTGVLVDAAKRAHSEGRLIIAATGNDGREIMHTPACLETALAVGAADWEGRPLSFSNYGRLYHRNAVLAPGYEIPGAGLDGGLCHRTGTSFATPVVTGVAALLLSRMLDCGREADTALVRRLILETAAPAIPEENISTQRVLVGRIHFEQLFAAFERELDGQANKERTMSETTPTTQPAEAVVTPQAAVTASEADVATPVVPVQVATEGVAAQAATAPVAQVQMVPQMVAVQPATVMAPVAQPVVPVAEAPVAPVAPSSVDNPRSAGQRVYCLGSLGYDFQIEARQDYFIQRIKDCPDPNVDQKLFRYLLENDAWEDADLLTWVVKIDATPVYAIRPAGSNRKDLLKLMTACLFFQQDKNTRPDPAVDFKTAVQHDIEGSHPDLVKYGKLDVSELQERNPGAYFTYLNEAASLWHFSKENKLDVERIAFAGEVVGETILFNGNRVPTIEVALSGMLPWDVDMLIQSLKERAQHDDGHKDGVDPAILAGDTEEAIRRALDKLYVEFKNDGVSDDDRAINYVGSNIVMLSDILQDVYRTVPGTGERCTRYELDSFYVEDSKVQRPTSILKDVVVRFFEPGNLDRAFLCYRFTVDVSDVNPVMVEGKSRRYYESSIRHH